MSGVHRTTEFVKNSSTSFVVKNIAPRGKRIQIFRYPIANQQTRDLLAIPYVSEADIRHSLLKGELMIKIKNKEIEVVQSDIDLLQFNNEQKQFLKGAGVVKGLEIGIEQLDPSIALGGAGNVIVRENVMLLGARDGVNRIFMTPEKFITGLYLGSIYSIRIRHNGRGMDPDLDYDISESGGAGTGYDTIFFKSFTPSLFNSILADYTVKI
jgi:hypothetical protein